MDITNISRSKVAIIEIYQFHLERILHNKSAFFYGDSMFLDILDVSTAISPSMKPFLDGDLNLFEDCQYHQYLKQIGLTGYVRKIAIPFMESQSVIDKHLSYNPEHLYINDARNMFFTGLIYGETEQELDQRQREWCETVELLFEKTRRCLSLMDEYTKERFINDKLFRTTKILSMRQQ